MHHVVLQLQLQVKRELHDRLQQHRVDHLIGGELRLAALVVW
jgi:hypothetical protein